MKTHRFFIDQKLAEQEEVSITEQSIIHQMRNVLRLQEGDLVILLDSTGIEWHGEVKVLIKKYSIISKIKIKKFSKDSKIKIKLFSSVIKKDKFEWVLQKGTELGVSEFSPIISDRTEKLKLNEERAKLIIREASEQSERLYLPKFKIPVSLEEALKKSDGECIALELEKEKINVSEILNKKEVSIFVGPEGGWSKKDLELFEENNVKLISLGDQVLRAETASVAVASLLLLN